MTGDKPRRRLALLTILIGLSWPSLASADPSSPGVEWNPAWRRFSVWDGAATLAMGGGALAIALSDYRDDRDPTPALNDEAVRDGLLATSRAGRNTARVIGDRIFQLSLVYPYLVDALLVTWIGNRAPDVAGQMALMDLQAQAFAAVIGLSTAHFVARARPSTPDCERDSGYERHCDAVDRSASFMSGHTATVATTAGLICAHNSKLRLYGDTPFGLVECVTGIAAATTTGITRIIADRHWHTDVVSGATLGVISGYVLPMLLHYGWGDDANVAVTPQTSPDLSGLAISGSF